MPKNVFLFPIFQIEIYRGTSTLSFIAVHYWTLGFLCLQTLLYVFFKMRSLKSNNNHTSIFVVYFNKFEIKCNRSCRFIRKCLHIKSAISFMLNMFIIKSNNVLKRHETKKLTYTLHRAS